MVDTFENTGVIVYEQGPSPYMSFYAGETLSAGDVVYISADGTVSKTTTSGQGFIGVVTVGGASGKKVTVAVRNAKVRAKAYGTVTANDAIVAGPGGTVMTLADVAAGDLSTSAATATAINNAKSRRATCDTGAASGGLAVIIL